MFDYCEQYPDDTTEFNDFVRKCTILDAIYNITAAWREVPERNTVKSFNKVFSKEKWEKLAGNIND